MTDIDFIGIDWYAPLSDWRDGQSHLDRLDGVASIHNPDYLAGQVEGGEGYDWYYASDADRDAQIRTPITDGAHAEPWVYRYKDLRNWWGQAHHDRIGGIRQASPTAWVPQSKPVRLVELGCPAVDKGANQPNVFIDPKSSESTAPYFSNGARDDLIQRRYVEALLGYWQGSTNPISSVYGGPMLDLQHAHVWTWDARPFPEFPARGDVWTDGPNWRLGHWLTGRAGQSDVGGIVSDLAKRAGLADIDTSAIEGVLAGYAVLPGSRVRDEIERLGAVFGFELVDRAGGAVCVAHSAVHDATAIRADALVVDGAGPELEFQRDLMAEQPVEARVHFFADDGDYQPASASALGLDHLLDATIDIRLPALSDRDIASDWAQDALMRAIGETETARLRLPPSNMALETGDPVRVDTGPDGRIWRLVSTEGMAVRQCDLVAAHPSLPATSGPRPASDPAPAPYSRPALTLLDLPLGPSGAPRNGFWAVVWSDPWPGRITLYAGTSVEAASQRADITAPGFWGTLIAPLATGFEGRWDRSSRVSVQMRAGSFQSVEASDVLNGANRVAVEAADGWEILSFANATLEPDGSWTLSQLLRGLGGTLADGADIGSKLIFLDGAGATLPVKSQEAEAALTVLAVPPGKALNHHSVRQVQANHRGVESRPLSPVHLRTVWKGDDLHVSWVRRARSAADVWSFGEVELDEAREAYSVTVLQAGNQVLNMDVETPSCTLGSATLAALFPAGLSNAMVQVAQISDGYGSGRSAQAALDPES